jgi:hypothetical protein
MYPSRLLKYLRHNTPVSGPKYRHFLTTRTLLDKLDLYAFEFLYYAPREVTCVDVDPSRSITTSVRTSA